MKLLGWNPCSLVKPYRSDHISTEFSEYDVILCPGTRLRCPHSRNRYTSQHVEHFAINWGWARGEHTNRSAGCSIFLRTGRFRSKEIRRLWDAPQPAQGRQGALRLQRTAFDITPVVIYIAPKPPNCDKVKQWQRGVDLLLSSLDQLLFSLCSRTCPVVFLDCNDCLAQLDGYEGVVGIHACQYMGYVGTCITQIAHMHNLVAVDTYHPCAFTYAGPNGHRSWIDHCFIPEQAQPHTSVRMLTARAARTQLIPDKKLRDHVPMSLYLWFGFGIKRVDEPAVQWDKHVISMCLQRGWRRQEFLDAL